MMQKQVNKKHYEFKKYFHQRRWASMWHQVDEVMSFNPETILEIGPGIGLFKAIASVLGPLVETLDVDPELDPDHVASVVELPFRNDEFDVVCAFQMLEHIPYEKSLQAFQEMARVAKYGVVISLPNAKRAWPFTVYIPKKGQFSFYLVWPLFRPKDHVFDGQHYWEINKKGYMLDKIIRDFSFAGDLDLVKNYRAAQNPFHHFLIFKKKF